MSSFLLNKAGFKYFIKSYQHVIIRKKVFLFIKIMLMMACSNQIFKINSNIIFPNLVSMLAIFYYFLANTFMSHRQ